MIERITTAGVFLSEGKVLVAKRPHGGALSGKWEFPGGKNRWGESAGDTLRREWREELDADVETGEELLSFDFVNKDVLYHLVCLRIFVSGGVDTVFHTSVAMVDGKELALLDMGGSDDRIRKFLIDGKYV